MIGQTTTIPLHCFGGSGPTLNLALANGFPPQTYTPLMRHLLDDVNAVSIPPRALWPGETPPQPPVSWPEMLAPDLLNGLRQHNLTDVIGVGHSFGGIATLLAAITEPSRFRALILLDPTVLPRRAMWWIRLMHLLGRDSTPLVGRTARRRMHFQSTDEAFEFFRTKPLFADWPAESLRAYVDSMLPAPEGGLILAWPREWEAYYFNTIHTGIWRDLPGLRDIGIPVLTIRGSTSDTMVADAAAAMCRLLPEMHYAEVFGHGHLFPQSAPEQTAHIMQGWLQRMTLT